MSKNCYVPLSRNYPIPKHLTLDNTIFWPEKRMTTMEKWYSGCPKDFHVVTDEPILVTLYPRESVFVWNGESWRNPNVQTFGANPSNLLYPIWGYQHGIVQAVIDGKITNVMGRGIKNK
jgi:hypothetical protein